MKVKYLIVILSLALAIITASCDVSNIIPADEPRQVLHMVGVTSNNQYFLDYRTREVGWYISLDRSYDILDKYPVVNCEAWSPILYLNDGLVDHSIDSFNCPNNYNFEYPLVVDSIEVACGIKYQVKVENDSFQTIEANYTHPDSVPLRIIDFSYLGPGEYSAYDGYSTPGNYYDVEVEVQDPEDLNYYELYVSIKLEYMDQTDGSILFVSLNDGAINFDAFDQDLLAVPDQNGIDLNLFFTDETFNNSTKRIKIRCFIDERAKEYLSNGMSDIKPYLVVFLRNYSPELFHFYRASYLQKRSIQDPNSAPMPVHSNIEGGFGIFGGYAENQQFIEIDLVNPQ